jgi:hypothetical protein
VADEGVLGFSGSRADDGAPACFLGEPDRVECLGQGADLVQFDENRVCDITVDALADAAGIRGEQVITYELDF